MTISATRAAIAAGLALVLASCGGASQPGGDGAPDATTAPASNAMPAKWNATDACSILDKAVVAEALKIEITETQLDSVKEPDAITAGTSECSYLDATGTPAATLMTRWSPMNDNSPGTIGIAREAAASALKAMSDEPLEDIHGLGKAAFFVPTINQLQVFIDDARMIVVTSSRVPSGTSAKDIAVALAHKAGA